MNKEIVPYTKAFELKQLGFDEECFGWYDAEYKDIINYDRTRNSCGWLNDSSCSAPTFSQAFKFFREKYGYDCSFEDELAYDDDDKEIEMWDFFIYKTKQTSDKKMTFCSNNYSTYVESFCKEEAELSCLRKLIEIVKNK